MNTMLTAALVLGVMSTTPASIAPPPDTPPVSFVLPGHTVEAPPVEAPQESVQALISRIAKEYGVSSTTMYNVAWSESKFDPDPKGHNDGGLAAGIVQIHYKTWHFTKEQVLDPEFSLRFLAKHIKAGDAWKYWTSLNCYTYVNTKFDFDLPKMAEIKPTASSPQKGAVAIFWYRDNKTKVMEKHVALVTDVSNGAFTVTEANFKPGVIGTRTIKVDDPHLEGYWVG